MTPISVQAEDDLRYDEWEYTRRLAVEKTGQGQIGYVHLRAMGPNDIADFAREFYTGNPVNNNVLAYLWNSGVQISGNGSGSVAVTSGGNTLYTASGLTNATVLTFTARTAAGADADVFEAGIRGVGYINTDEAMAVQTRVITISAIDVDGNIGLPANTYIHMQGVNDAPNGVDSSVGTATAYVEDDNYTFAVTDFGFNDNTDVDGGNNLSGNSLMAVTITTLPATGTLERDGVAVTAGQSIDVQDIDDGLLVYVPVQDANNNDANTPVTFTFQVQDNGGTANSGVDLDPTAATMTISITPDNDAPVLVELTSQAADITEDEDVNNPNAGQTVAAILGNSAMTDVDNDNGGSHAANNGILKGIAVFDTSTGGNVTYALGTGWQYSVDGGSSWHGFSIGADQAVLLRSNDLVRFVADGANGTTVLDLPKPTLSYYAWDQSDNTANNMQGSQISITTRGGTTSLSEAAGVMSITVTDINDLPVIDLNGATSGVDNVGMTNGVYNGVAFNPRGDAVNVFEANVTSLTDVDHTATIKKMVVTLAADSAIDNQSLYATQNHITYETLNLAVGSSLPAGITVQGNGSGTDGMTDATVLTFSSADGNLTSDFETALSTIIYNNTNSNAFSGTRTVSVDVWDDTADLNAAAQASADIDVQVTWGAVIDVNGTDAGRNYAVTYTENDGAVLVTDDQAEITDQNGFIKSLTATLQNDLDGGYETLSVSANDIALIESLGMTVTVAGDGKSVVFGLDANHTAGLDGTYFQVAMRAVRYTNSSEDPTAGERRVLFTSRDMDTTFDINGNAGVSAYTTIGVGEGVNDRPVFSLEAGDGDIGTRTEDTDAVLVGTVSTLTVTDTVTLTDVDYKQTDTLTVAGVTAAGVDTGLTEADALAMFSLDPLTLAADPTHQPGDPHAVSVSWTFSAANTAFDYLAAGETVTLTYTIRATDNSGAASDNSSTSSTADSIVEITITGTNDAPVLSAVGLTGDVTEANSGAGVDFDLLSGATDADASDVLYADGVTYTVGGVATGNGGTDLPAGVTLTGNTLTVDPTAAAFNGLALGQTLDIVASYDVTDGTAPVAQSMTVTVTGTNDAPDISVQAFDAVDENDVISDTGNIVMSDVDDGAALTATAAYNTGSIAWKDANNNAAGELSQDVIDALVLADNVFLTTVVSPSSPSNTQWNTMWTYDAGQLDLDFLKAGEHIELSYTVTVTDEHNAATTDVVTVRINGTNDTPTVTVSAATAFTEDSDAFAQDLSQTGTVSFDDIDVNDAIDITSAVTTAASWSGGALTVDEIAAVEDAFSVSATDAAAPGQVSWDYSLAAADLDFLADGETITVTYTVTATDSAGATATDTVTITINGTNDAPVVTGAVDGSVDETLGVPAQNAANISTTGSITLTDLDWTDTHTAWVHGVPQNPVGTLTVDSITPATGGATGAVNWLYEVDPQAVEYLAVGESRTETYLIRTMDYSGQGNSFADTYVDITITGSNDAPIITIGGADSGAETLAETNGVISTSGTLTATDVDTSDSITTSVTLAVDDTGVEDPHGLMPSASALAAMFTVTASAAANTGDVNNLSWAFNSGAASAFDFLDVGETLTLTYTLRATDSSGTPATDDQTVTVTVLDVDDTAPLITGPSGGAGAAASAISINEGLTAVTTFTANEKVTWSLDGGSDAASFRIDPATGALVFVAAPDFENPTDSDRNNTYVVRIKAVDAAGNVSYQTLTVTVLNVDEIGRKLAQIGDKLRTGLRSYVAQSLGDMLSFNESLMRAANDDACTAPKGKGLSGAANANQSGGQVKLGYSQQLTDCGRRNQVFADFGLTYSKLGGNWNSRMFASLRFERRVDADLTLGAALMASQASDTLTGFANSSISDESLQLNVYGRYRISDTLRTGAFAGYGQGWYDFGLAESDGFVLDGKMTGKRQVYGWMLSGDFNLGETVITTDAIVSHAKEKLGSATLAARYLGENRTGIAFAVGSVDTTRISVPVTAPIQLTGNDELGKSARLLLSPGLLCEDNDIQSSSLRCGYQLGAKLVANDGGRNRFYADYRWESVAGNRRSLVGLGYAYRLGSDGKLELALEANRGLTGSSGQDNRALVSLRLVH